MTRTIQMWVPATTPGNSEAHLTPLKLIPTPFNSCVLCFLLNSLMHLSAVMKYMYPL